MATSIPKWLRIAATVVVSASAGVFAAGTVIGRATANAEAGRETDTDHEARIRKIEAEVPELRGDMKALTAELHLILQGQDDLKDAIHDLAKEIRK